MQCPAAVRESGSTLTSWITTYLHCMCRSHQGNLGRRLPCAVSQINDSWNPANSVSVLGGCACSWMGCKLKRIVPLDYIHVQSNPLKLHTPDSTYTLVSA